MLIPSFGLYAGRSSSPGCKCLCVAEVSLGPLSCCCDAPGLSSGLNSPASQQQSHRQH
jgi:hypothetical protein